MRLNKMKRLSITLLFSTISYCSYAQYVQPERNDTTKLFPKAVFDVAQTKAALQEGKSTIKGVAFVRPVSGTGFTKKVFANKVKIILYPLTPYFEEYLSLRKKANAKKLQFAYISPECYAIKLIAITNSTGEFTFPNLKPGKYYLEAMMPWVKSGVYDQYTGSGYDDFGRIDFYSPAYYSNNHYTFLQSTLEIKNDGDVVKATLRGKE